MKKAIIERLAKHALAENMARVGYPYPERKDECQFARENQPETRAEFTKILELVKAEWGGVLPSCLAALLTGTHLDSTLPPHADKWLNPARQKASKTQQCQHCSRPAVGVSNFGGWCCGKHYDEFS